MFGGLFGGGEVEFISDGEIFARLRELILKAEGDVLLVAPYLEPNDDLVRVLKQACATVDVGIWFREDKVGEYRSQPWFRELLEAGIEFRAIKNLHAKIYAIDDRCIVTSMNLTKSSWNNSREFGCVVSLESKQANRIHDYLESLGDESSEVDAARERKSKQRKWGGRKGGSSSSARSRPDGHCIRCSDSIPFNPARPYCANDYAKWAEYANEDYKDKFCHKCGAETVATMRRPLCLDCFKRG